MDLIPRVLSDPTRRTILDLVRERGTPAVTVDQVAAAVEVHRTVAFEHLEMLAEAGLLERGILGGRRGRPARTYRFAGRAVQFGYPPRQHQLLASVLVEALAAHPRQTESVQRVARGVGFELASGKRGAGGAVRALSSLGGRYQLRGDTLHARNCIFRETCAEHDLVCRIHSAVIAGALEAAGSNRLVIPGGADGTGGCWYRLERAGSVGPQT